MRSTSLIGRNAEIPVIPHNDGHALEDQRRNAGARQTRDRVDGRLHQLSVARRRPFPDRLTGALDWMRDAETSQIRREQGKQPALGDIERHRVIWRIGRQPVGKGRPGRGLLEQRGT